MKLNSLNKLIEIGIVIFIIACESQQENTTPQQWKLTVIDSTLLNNGDSVLFLLGYVYKGIFTCS